MATVAPHPARVAPHTPYGQARKPAVPASGGPALQKAGSIRRWSGSKSGVPAVTAIATPNPATPRPTLVSQWLQKDVVAGCRIILSPARRGRRPQQVGVG